MAKSAIFLILCIFYCYSLAVTIINGNENLFEITQDQDENQIQKNIYQARYDNYRMYYVTLETDEHVKVFQNLEERSDSYTFYGHARLPGQNLTIMVAAHKIAEIEDILETYRIEYQILVKFFFFVCLYFQ